MAWDILHGYRKSTYKFWVSKKKVVNFNLEAVSWLGIIFCIVISVIIDMNLKIFKKT